MKLKLVTLIIGLSAVSRMAMAIPIFGSTEGTVKDGIVTLYKDSVDPKKVYFFPNSTRFSYDRNNIPMFSFTYWGLDTPATEQGAYMTMASHLTSDSDQQTALDNYMKNNPDIKVAVLPVKSSVIGLSTTDPSKAPLGVLFKEFNFSKVGGRAEDEIGINAVLTPVGAKAFKALLTKAPGGSAMKFDYCYTVQGLGPNMDAEIIVDMRRVYDYFEVNSSGGWGWFSASIRKVVETLNQQNAIRVKMHGGDAKMWDYLQLVSETITKRLFTPELTATPGTVAQGNRIFNFGATSVHKEELKEETWKWDRQDIVDREFCTAVTVKDLDKYRSQLVISAD